MDYKRLGTRIREERKRLNLTQAQFTEDIDISDTYMGTIERSELRPSYPSCPETSHEIHIIY